MIEYDTFESVRDALRYFKDYFKGDRGTHMYLVIDTGIGHAAITDRPLSVIEDWVESEHDLGRTKDFKVYLYRKSEKDVGWKCSYLAGYVRKECKVLLNWKFELSGCELP